MNDIVWLHDLTVDTHGRFTMRPEIYSNVRSRCNLMLLALINQAHPILVLICWRLVNHIICGYYRVDRAYLALITSDVEINSALLSN